MRRRRENRRVRFAMYLCVLLCVPTIGVHAESGTYAVVDMDAIIQQHPDTATAESVLKRQADEYEAERASMLKEVKALQGHFDLLRDETESLALSESGRLRKRREAEDIVLKIRTLERDVSETTSLRQKQLTDRRRRMRKRIVEDIGNVISDFAKERNIKLILEKHSAQSGVNMVIYFDDAIDVTEDIGKRVAELRE